MRLSLFLFPLLAAAQTPEFATVLEKHCLACHGAEKGLSGLRLHTRAAALKGGNRGSALIPDDPAKSLLYSTTELAPGTTLAMPPGGPRIPAPDRAILKAWVTAGAPWPDTLTLKLAQPKIKDDQALVARLHLTMEQATELNPYKRIIPNSTVEFEMLPVPGDAKVAPFWMAKYEVTWDEYRLFMFQNLANEARGAEPALDAISRPTKPYVEMSFGMGINGFPAISMTQHAANKFAQWLSAKTGQFYRLPTEAEWEHACRLGDTEATPVNDRSWFVDNSPESYQQVGKKKPNKLGLFDMLGNVAEWTLDQYDEKSYGKPLPSEGYILSTKPYPHVAKGGAWSDPAQKLGCGQRIWSDPQWKMQDPQLPKSIWYLTDAQFLGFRLVRPLKVPSAAQMFRYWNNGVERE